MYSMIFFDTSKSLVIKDCISDLLSSKSGIQAVCDPLLSFTGGQGHLTFTLMTGEVFLSGFSFLLWYTDSALSAESRSSVSTVHPALLMYMYSCMKNLKLINLNVSQLRSRFCIIVVCIIITTINVMHSDPALVPRHSVSSTPSP